MEAHSGLFPLLGRQQAQGYGQSIHVHFIWGMTPELPKLVALGPLVALE